ncbi:MAG: class I SAM-dependent RNA methyltransferase [Polyangiaceae bacterium]|nr:class I SAM-dependent RNA methyltransferase [Polyangiaceae bacterium]
MSTEPLNRLNLHPTGDAGLCTVSARCGGCPLIDDDPTEQRRRKLAEVASAFGEVGVRLPAEPKWVSSPQSIGYRNRVRLRIQPTGTVAFFNEVKSGGCAVLETALAELVHETIYLSESEPEHFRPYQHLEARGCDADGRASLYLTLREGSQSNLVAIRRRLPDVIVADSNCSPRPVQRYETTPGVHMSVPLDCFLQINQAVNRTLVEQVVGKALELGANSFADIYCGSGNLALPLMAAGLTGVGVDHEGPAIQSLASAFGPHGSRAIAGDAVTVSQQLVKEGQLYDLVLLDPPRAGVPHGLREMAQLSRQAMAMCSCNPKTLARDLRQLSGEFQLESLTVFDMFPHTRHVEVMAWLRRKPQGTTAAQS